MSGAGLAGEHISFATWHPEEQDVVRFLSIATDTNRAPVLVHCQHGADRTGTMCAIYRIVVQGWPRAEAIREMKEGGFGFHSVWQNLVRYMEDLDVEGVRRKAGLPAPDRTGGQAGLPGPAKGVAP
jgi:protein tyrosine/serine phosphatase